MITKDNLTLSELLEHNIPDHYAKTLPLIASNLSSQELATVVKALNRYHNTHQLIREVEFRALEPSIRMKVEPLYDDNKSRLADIINPIVLQHRIALFDSLVPEED